MERPVPPCLFADVCDTFRAGYPFSVARRGPAPGWHPGMCPGVSGTAHKNWGYGPTGQDRYHSPCDLARMVVESGAWEQILALSESIGVIADASTDLAEHLTEWGYPVASWIWMYGTFVGLTGDALSYLAPDVQKLLNQSCTGYGVIDFDVSQTDANLFERIMNDTGWNWAYEGFYDPELYNEGQKVRPQLGNSPGGYECMGVQE
jgi:hypothetical protein